MPGPLPPLFILRHGETEWNREGRLQGHLDSPLTHLGRAQAARQAAILARVLPRGARALTSDSLRARETARIALRGLALPVDADPRLREVALGAWQGLTIAEVRAGADGEGPRHAWKFEAPGGERLDALAARAAAVLAEIAGPTVIVTHGLTSRVLRCLALGLPPEALEEVAGGQGVVHVIEDCAARVLAA
jgi:probable phosphoglycerate mutase